EADERSMRYQGIVPLTGGSLSECLATYFASSEQLPTRVRLAADADAAVGMLLLRLPEPPAQSERALVDEAWEDAGRGLDSLPRSELLHSAIEGILSRNFERHDVRLFRGAPV